MTYTLHGDNISLPTTGDFFKDIVSDMFEKKYAELKNYKKHHTYDIALSIIQKYPKAKFTIGVSKGVGSKTIFKNAYLAVTADCNKRGEYYRIYFMI